MSNQRVYIVSCCVDYEGAYTYAVYASKESAQAEVDRLNGDKPYSTEHGCDNHILEEVEVLP